MSTSYLPVELLLLVLILLPAKVVGRFKIVSKSWNLLISSQEFIKLHTDLLSNPSRNTRIPDLILHPKIVSRHTKIHLVVQFSTMTSAAINCEIQRVHHPFEESELGRRVVNIIGTCNGLLCQILIDNKSWEYDISLSNPLMELYWMVPKRLSMLSAERRRLCFYGFGYDDVHDDYKVIIAFERGQGNGYIYEVYGLESNIWRSVDTCVDVRGYSSRGDKDGMLVNCALHWIFANIRADSYVNKVFILVFDLRTDQHKILQVPNTLKNTIFLKLSVLDGCLVIRNQRNTDEGHDFSFDLWVMKVYGSEDSWTRIRIDNPPSYNFHLLSPVALLEGKLVYYTHDRDRKTLLYDLESQASEVPSKSWGVRNVKQLQFVCSLVQPHPPSFSSKKICYQIKGKETAQAIFKGNPRLDKRLKI